MPKLKQAVERTRTYVGRCPGLSRLIGAEPEDIEHVELAFESTLLPVRPSDSFRDHLKHNLELAAQHAVVGPEIEYPRPLHRRLWIGLSAGVLAAGLTAVLVRLFWPRTRAEQ